MARDFRPAAGFMSSLAWRSVIICLNIVQTLYMNNVHGLMGL